MTKNQWIITGISAALILGGGIYGYIWWSNKKRDEQLLSDALTQKLDTRTDELKSNATDSPDTVIAKSIIYKIGMGTLSITDVNVSNSVKAIIKGIVSANPTTMNEGQKALLNL